MNKVKTYPPSKSYHEYLIKSLKNDPEEAAGYLNAALEDGDYRVFLGALRDVAEALGGISKLAKKTKLSRPNLYRMLSEKGKPEITSLYKVLKAFGLTLAVSPSKKNSGFKEAA